MALLKIVKYPSRILKQVSKSVKEVDEEIRKLLDDMAETMYHARGVGLAAPQVGVDLRCIVVDTGIERPDGTIEPNLIQIINPEIISREGEVECEEGCLSIPEFTLKMKRSAKIRVAAVDKFGKTVEFDAKGLLAVAIQHEIDHLDGKLLIDSVSQLRREMYIKKQRKKKLGEKEPVYL